MKTVADFIFWGSKITADSNCSHEIKRLTPQKGSYDQPRKHVKKQRHYLPKKVHLIKAMVFPVVMYGYESWTIRKAECQRIDAFELWCWRRLLRVPQSARRSNQSILKEISPEYSLEGLMLTFQSFGHLMQRTDLLEKTFMLWKVGGSGWDDWMASLTGLTWVWASSGSWWWTGRPGMLQSKDSLGHKESDMTEQLNWTAGVSELFDATVWQTVLTRAGLRVLRNDPSI